MRRYQLMGSKRVPEHRRKNEYPKFHICSLPHELVVEIFLYLQQDIIALLRMSLTCHKFNSVISKNFLYKDIEFKTYYQFEKFSHEHLPVYRKSFRKLGMAEPSSKVNYIQTVHFVNPPTKDSEKFKTSIAGSYDVETVVQRGKQKSYTFFVDALKCLLAEAYGIRQLTLSEISPRFSFPEEIISSESSFSFALRSPKQKRILHKLVLKAQNGWTIPFKLNHISTLMNTFDTINELSLHNFAIHDSKLVSLQIPKPICIDLLTLNSCIYSDHLMHKTPAKKRVGSELFAQTHTVQLLSIQAGQDLSFIDFVKLNNHLTVLILDLTSKIFYEFSNNDISDKNFNFTKYNNFFKLICSGQGGYSSLKEIVLMNFELFDCYGHIHNIKEPSTESQDDNWAESATDRFHSLLSYLSQVKNVTFILCERPNVVHKCIKCGFTTGVVDEDEDSDVKTINTLNQNEWNYLLNPLLTGNTKCNIRILDHNHRPVFTRISETLHT